MYFPKSATEILDFIFVLRAASICRNKWSLSNLHILSLCLLMWRKILTTSYLNFVYLESTFKSNVKSLFKKRINGAVSVLQIIHQAPYYRVLGLWQYYM